MDIGWQYPYMYRLSFQRGHGCCHLGTLAGLASHDAGSLSGHPDMHRWICCVCMYDAIHGPAARHFPPGCLQPLPADCMRG